MLRGYSESLGGSSVLCLGNVVNNPPFFSRRGDWFSMLCFDGLDEGKVIFLV